MQQGAQLHPLTKIGACMLCMLPQYRQHGQGTNLTLCAVISDPSGGAMFVVDPKKVGGIADGFVSPSTYLSDSLPVLADARSPSSYCCHPLHSPSPFGSPWVGT